MNRIREYYDSGDDDENQARFVQRCTCPVCLLTPCSETCPIGFTQDELDALRERLLGHRSSNDPLE